MIPRGVPQVLMASSHDLSNIQFQPQQVHHHVQQNQSTRRGRQQQQKQQQAPPTKRQQRQQQQQRDQDSFFAEIKSSTKAWHGQEHADIRNSVAEEIIKLLKMRRPNAPEDWLEKLPHMVRPLEEALYHTANDLSEYVDNASMKHRLQQLALSMGGNKQQHAVVSDSKIPAVGPAVPSVVNLTEK
jgi:hypothetical protein